ncbi:hypothetical protein HR11_02415 [Porphyromonas macacae]|nr:hypothetical protein HR11_02415 [Porphyromonas macacae]
MPVFIFHSIRQVKVNKSVFAYDFGVSFFPRTGARHLCRLRSALSDKGTPCHDQPFKSDSDGRPSLFPDNLHFLPAGRGRLLFRRKVTACRRVGKAFVFHQKECKGIRGNRVVKKRLFSC